MRASHPTLGARAGTLECVVVDGGRLPVDRHVIAGAIRSILAGQVAELARDRNAICYRVQLAQRDAPSCAAIVKAPRPGPQRTNADTTFAREAEILAALPAAGITDAPELLARVAAEGTHFLVATELRGKHPDPRTHPLDGRQLLAILDRLYVMDRQAFMHYDLKAANILIDGDRAGFVDFEFARFEGLGGAFAPGTAAFGEDFNVSGNPFFPARSNVANFEFRAFQRYLHELGVARSVAAADALLRDWLRGKSAFHLRLGAFLADLAETSSERIARVGGIATVDAQRRMREAAAYEKLLATLFEEPHDTVSRVERSLMAYRCAVFEQRPAEADRLQRATLADIRRDAAQDGALPDAYRRATVRVLDLVRRSVHPGA